MLAFVRHCVLTGTRLSIGFACKKKKTEISSIDLWHTNRSRFLYISINKNAKRVYYNFCDCPNVMNRTFEAYKIPSGMLQCKGTSIPLFHSMRERERITHT